MVTKSRIYIVVVFKYCVLPMFCLSLTSYVELLISYDITGNNLCLCIVFPDTRHGHLLTRLVPTYLEVRVTDKTGLSCKVTDVEP